MSDERIRELERQASQGDVEAEARLLRARRRRGELSQERLRLAAYLGHEAAVVALGEEAPPVPADLGEWLKGLAGFGTGPALRGFLALGNYAIREHGKLSADDLPPWALPLLDSLGPLPGETAKRAPSSRLETVRRWAGVLHGVLRGELEPEVTARLFRWLLERFEVDLDLDIPPETAAQLRPRVRAELLPWALGTGDPVRMRVAKRGEIAIRPEDLDAK